ncbi:helix-turn-helix domain-containing protein [Staphylococcus warneri]|uniref:helix-turn-helix domain-containing protein n=1 Tax=Staphylococcus warneri TaxID=1292 RepID=UPI00165CDB52|nr:helix-turn-helix domain-containing protein [Staphylococcus warneri]QNQ45163.1 helix-turn-helix domain-containing protein [Staphylococcus warneri]
MTDQPSYYSIITANVRYDNRLTDSEKLLFAEITSLSNKYGYCTASNGYFAKLYEVTKVTISRRIANLKECGYLNVEIVREGNEIKQRKMYPLTEMLRPINTNDNTPINTNVKENNTRFNNTRINRDRDDVTNSFKYISNNLEIIQSPLKAQQLEETINDFKDNKLDIITVATDYCKENNKGINYLIKVLENWNKDGVDTKEKAIAKVTPKQPKEDDYLARKKQEILGG